MKSISILNAYRRIKITRTVETFEGFIGEESKKIPTIQCQGSLQSSQMKNLYNSEMLF